MDSSSKMGENKSEVLTCIADDIINGIAHHDMNLSADQVYGNCNRKRKSKKDLGDNNTNNTEPEDDSDSCDFVLVGEAGKSGSGVCESGRDESARCDTGRFEPARCESRRDEPSRRESGRFEPARCESRRDEPSRRESGRFEPARSESRRDEPSRRESGRFEPARSESRRDEPSRRESGRFEPARSESRRDEPSRRESGRFEPARCESRRDEPSRRESGRFEPARSESRRDEPSRRESGRFEPARSESRRDEPSRRESGRFEPARCESRRDEPSRRESGRFEPARSESRRDEPSRRESGRFEPARCESRRDEPSRRESGRFEPARCESRRDEPSRRETGRDEPARCESDNGERKDSQLETAPVGENQPILICTDDEGDCWNCYIKDDGQGGHVITCCRAEGNASGGDSRPDKEEETKEPRNKPHPSILKIRPSGNRRYSDSSSRKSMQSKDSLHWKEEKPIVKIGSKLIKREDEDEFIKSLPSEPQFSSAGIARNMSQIGYGLMDGQDTAAYKKIQYQDSETGEVKHLQVREEALTITDHVGPFEPVSKSQYRLAYSGSKTRRDIYKRFNTPSQLSNLLDQRFAEEPQIEHSVSATAAHVPHRRKPSKVEAGQPSATQTQDSANTRTQGAY